MAKTASRPVVQISPRGGLTLPATVRKALGVGPGDALIVSVEDGRIILQPAAVVAVERYTPVQESEFAHAAAMTPAEIKEARRKWRR